MSKENFFDDLMEEGAGKIAPTDGELTRLNKLAQKQIELQLEVEAAEERVEQLKKELRQVSEHELPEAMDTVGLTEFKTADGDKITVDDIIRCSIPKERKEDAFAWLRENEGEGLIKNEVKVPFVKGEDEKANELVKKLSEMGLEAGLFSDVHWQTLNAWAKEQIKAGKALDAELLGLYTGRATKIKLNKRKEAKGSF